MVDMHNSSLTKTMKHVYGNEAVSPRNLKEKKKRQKYFRVEMTFPRNLFEFGTRVSHISSVLSVLLLTSLIPSLSANSNLVLEFFW